MKNKNKKPNIISRWYKLAEPSKSLWFWQTITYILYVIFYTIITIFAARTINCMYEGNWKWAFINLGIELLTLVLRYIFLHFEYIAYGKQHIHIRKVVAKKIYNKILSCESNKIKNFTKEKLINISLSNISYIAEFPDPVAKFIAILIQVIITLVIIFVANIWAGLIVIVVGVINFFVYYFYNKKMGKIMLEQHEKNDEVFQSYNKIIDGRAVINEFASKEKYEGEILDNVDKYSKAYARYYNVYSLKVNINCAVWNVIIYGVTALMLYFVSQGTLAIEVYLVIIPYLSSGTTKLTELFDKSSFLENMRVDVDRVNLILGLSDKELIQYGEINAETIGYNLGLISVNYENADKSSENYGVLKDVDISFKMNAINLIKGSKGSGKRLIFNLLRRYIKPQSGTVLLDNLDLYSYNEATFKSHIYYCSSHPTFIKGSIKENLLLANKDFKKIVDVCKNVEVYDVIMAMPNGFDTQISDIKASSTLFLIGLARAVLSNCKILMVYELPEDCPPIFRKKVKNLLKNYYIDKTIIIFSHSDVYDDISELIYEISNGKVKKVLTGQKEAPRKKEKVIDSDESLKIDNLKSAKKKTRKENQQKK